MPIVAILDFFFHLDAEVVLEVPAESDQKVKQLKSYKRAGTHDAYTLSVIEAQINQRFDVRQRTELPGGTRVLFDLTPKS